MKNKRKVVGIVLIMLVFSTVGLFAETIAATFICTDYPEDTIVLRKDGTCTITIDGESVSGTYSMDSLIARGMVTQIRFRLNDGSNNVFSMGWGTEDRRPWIAVDGLVFEMDSGIRR